MATRNIVPRADNEGNIGTTLKKWLKGWFGSIQTTSLTDGTKSINVADIVAGPASVTDNAIARFDGVTGKIVQDSGVKVDDSGVLTQQSTAALESAPLGSELLSSVGWTATDWTGDFATGFTHTTGNTTVLTNTLAAVTNNLYQIAFTVTNSTAGTFTVAFGGANSSAYSGTNAWGPKALSTGTLSITPTTDFNGTIVISIKQITGIYAPTYTIKDNAGTNAFEIRNTLSSRQNAFIGFGVGRYNTTGIYNSVQGANSLYSNTTGSSNSAQGYSSLYSNTTGSSNSAQGYSSLYFNTTGSSNSAQGVNAGRYNAVGGGNVTGNYSVFLGSETKAHADGETNQIVIGYFAIGAGSNSAVLGNDYITKTLLKGSVGVGIALPTSTLHAAGSLALPISTKTANYTATITDYTLLGDATSASFTITLPAVAGCSGRIYNVKKIDSSVNTVTIDGNASETIDGTLTKVISTQYESVQIQSNGTTWFVI